MDTLTSIGLYPDQNLRLGWYRETSLSPSVIFALSLSRRRFFFRILFVICVLPLSLS